MEEHSFLWEGEGEMKLLFFARLAPPASHIMYINTKLEASTKFNCEREREREREREEIYYVPLLVEG